MLTCLLVFPSICCPEKGELWDSLIHCNLFGKSKPAEQRPAPPVMAEQEEEIVVPEISPAQLKAQMQGDSCPLLLDVREPYEWNQVRIPAVPARTSCIFR